MGFVQRSAKTRAAFPITTSSLTGVAVGNSLVAYVCGFQGTPPTAVTFSDSASNTWSQAVFKVSGSRFAAIGICSQVTTGGTITVTVTPNGTGNGGEVWFEEYSGLVTTGILDKTASGGNNSVVSIIDSGASATTSQGSEILVACGTGLNGSSTTSFTANATGSNPTNWTVNATEPDDTFYTNAFIASVTVSSTLAADCAVTISPATTANWVVVVATLLVGLSPANFVPSMSQNQLQPWYNRYV